MYNVIRDIDPVRAHFMYIIDLICYLLLCVTVTQKHYVYKKHVFNCLNVY